MEPQGTDLMERALKSAVKAVKSLPGSYGQFLFTDHPVTGAAMALGLALISDASLLFSGLGILFCSGLAGILRKDEQKIAKGLYGFNGGLFGLFWSWYFQLSWVSLGLFFLPATGLAFAQLGFERMLRTDRTGIPFLGLPSVLLFLFILYPIYWITIRWQWLPAAAVYLPLGSTFQPFIDLPLLQKEGAAFIRDNYLHVWAVILLGIFFHSRRSFLAALYGLAIGTLIAWPVSLHLNLSPRIFTAFNALPLAIAFWGVFLTATAQGFFFMNVALILCGLIWVGSATLLGRVHLPFLTLPLNLVLFGGLVFLRSKGAGWKGLFSPVPHEAVAVERTLKAFQDAIIREAKITRLPFFRAKKRRTLTGLSNPAGAFEKLIQKSKKISILSGAGTSTESGIPDIRGRSPFWEQFRPEIYILSHFLVREDVRSSYWAMDRLFQRLIQEALPNGVHQGIKRLHDQGKLECIVTQNVDGLFQRAGIPPDKIIEIHGSCSRIRCVACRALYSRQELGLGYGIVRFSPRCPRCQGILKPDTIWMGEDVNPVLLGEAVYRICASDLLVLIGTTLIVEPVASLPRVALEKKVEMAIINLTPTLFDNRAALVVREQAGKFFEQFNHENNLSSGGKKP